MDKEQEKIGDDIYKSLIEIQKEEEVRLSDKAFITDCLSERLYKLGYRKLPEGKPPLLKPEKISDIVLRCYTDNKLSCVEWAVRKGVEAQWDIWNKAIYG